MIGDRVADMVGDVAPDGTLWVRVSPTGLDLLIVLALRAGTRLA
jgi:hypothetical protein